MGRKPNPLLQEFLDEDLPLPEIDWQTVPPGVNPMDAWDMFDENIEGWVPIWFPTGDLLSGKTFTEFERAYFFNDDLERILKAMRRWPLWGNPVQKKQAALWAAGREVGRDERDGIKGQKTEDRMPHFGLRISDLGCEMRNEKYRLRPTAYHLRKQID